MKNQFFVFICLLSFAYSINAQQISGCIKDVNTGEEIPNVSVYFSGTSMGVVSGTDGCFTIAYRPELNAPLVLSVLGYDKVSFENPLGTNLSEILLHPKIDDLEAVYLNPDPWTRKEKEQWFKKMFLGDIPESAQCSILNLKDVRLRFNPATGFLTAVSDVPIVVENRHLEYTIIYDLQEFEVAFEPIKIEGDLKISDKSSTETKYKQVSSYLGGYSFFKELDNKKINERRRAKRREAMYESSVLRFMRSLINQNAEKSGYLLYYDGKVANIKDHIRVRKSGYDFIIEFRHDNYLLIDKRRLQSELLLLEQRVMVDAYGNNLSPRAILYGGYFGVQQIAGLLPLEYGLEN